MFSIWNGSNQNLLGEKTRKIQWIFLLRYVIITRCTYIRVLKALKFISGAIIYVFKRYNATQYAAIDVENSETNMQKKPELEKEEQLEYVENKSIGLLRETKVVEHELLKLLQNILLNVW